MSLEQLPLDTGALLLRHAGPADVTALLSLSREETLRAWLPSQVYRDEAHARSVVEFLIGQYSTPADPRRGAYVLVVEHKSDRRLIGHVGFSPLHRGVEIGFAIAQEYQRQGLAVEAIVAACGWAFETFELDRILAVTSPANTASRKALTRAGFVYQGEEFMEFQGQAQPVSVYAIAPHRTVLGD